MEIARAPSGGTFQLLGFKLRTWRRSPPISHRHLPVSIPFHRPFYRTRLDLPERLFPCKAKSNASSLPLLEADKEEARAVLSLFLTRQGMSEEAAAETISRSDRFVDHLASELRRLHESRHLEGSELTTPELRDALLPYVESLLEEDGGDLTDAVEKFPDHAGMESRRIRVGRVARRRSVGLSPGKEETAACTGMQELPGRLSYNAPYLVDLGLDLDQLKEMARKHPPFANYSLEEKVKPAVEFLLDVGMARAGIPSILYRCPQFCGFKIEETVIPKMRLLEGLGVDKAQWPKVIRRYPTVFTRGREAMRETVNYLSELGISARNIGKILTQCPRIMALSLEGNLKPTVEYLRSLGVDVTTLMCRQPETFGLSIKKNLMLRMELLEGFGVDKAQWAKVVRRFPAIHALSMQNIRLTVDYLSELGISAKNIGKILTQWPGILCYSVDNKLRPMEEYFRSLGIDVATLLCYCPRTFCSSINENLIPKVEFLEGLGLDRSQWGKVIGRSPKLLSLSMENMKATVGYLFELGISAEHIGKILTRYPSILSYNVDRKLRPTEEYFRSLGIDVSAFICRCPRTFCLSMNENLIPKIEFLEGLGVDRAQWGKVINHYPRLLSLSMEKIKANVGYLFGLGISAENIGKILTRYPNILSYNVAMKLRPREEYFRSLGMDVATLMCRSPETFLLSLNENMVPKMDFVEGLGVDREQWANVIHHYPASIELSKQNINSTVDHLSKLGISTENIGKILRQCPTILCCDVDTKLRPTEQYFRSLGIDVATLMLRSPAMFGLSINESLIPKMKFLEGLGVNKAQWAKVLRSDPTLLNKSKESIKATVDNLSELGISSKNIGKVLTRCPAILHHNVDTNLRLTEEYFQSLGIDVATLMCHSPQTFGLSLELNIKPTTQFFLDKGFTIEEIQAMVLRVNGLYTLRLVENLMPKWEFFVTMDYPKSELVKCPIFFSLSLKKRIIPRYNLVRKCGFQLQLRQWLCASDSEFERILEEKMEVGI